MPKLGTSKRSNRDCLVCGTTTTVAHMGIDVCRACTVFYRRAHGKGKKYACRSGTSRCSKGKGLNCKKCRLRLLKDILKESCATDEISLEISPVLPSTNHATIIEHHETQPTSQVQLPPQNNFLPTYVLPNQGPLLPLLSRVRAGYDKLCYGRMMGEIFSRKDPPHPAKICSENHPVFPATFQTMNDANRVLMSCIMEFGKSTFPEFRQLTEEEQWSISVKFFYTFRKLDNSYRAGKRFPDQKNKIFTAYTLVLCAETADRFFDDFTSEKGDVEQAKKMMMGVCQTRNRVGRNTIERLRPDDQEFVAMVSMLFWATNGTGHSDEITQISEHYRQQVSSELHVHYRDILKLDVYASRLGEIFSFLPMFESHEKVKESFEVLRLLDIFNDDSFTYKLNKS